MMPQFPCRRMSGVGAALFAVCALAASTARGAMVTWVGTNTFSATTNWSDVNNWVQAGTSTKTSPANNAADFTVWTSGFGPGYVTVNVDGAYGSPGSGMAQSYGAFFAFTNGYQTVLIQPGITWMVQAQAGTPGAGIEVGPQPGANNALTNFVSPTFVYTNHTTFEGAGGTLLADSLGLRVEGSASAALNHYTILDMSALGTFVMTNNLQGGGANTASNGFYVVNGAPNSQALVYLALTNVITLLDAVQVGYLGSSGNTLPIGVYLGQSNYISTGPSNNNLIIGSAGCANGFLQFNPALLGGANPPSVYLTGSGGSQNVLIADANGGAAPGSAVCDLNGGAVTWLANTMSIGISGSGSVSANGLLSFDTGNVYANTVLAGVQPVSGGAAAVGTINVGSNAMLQVNNALVLGNVTGTAASGTIGTVNVTNGTLVANVISNGGGAGALNVTGGYLVGSSVSISNGSVHFTNARWNVALTTALATNMVVANFNAGGATNYINITALPAFLGTTIPARFHLIAGNVTGGATLGLGTLPPSPNPSYPYGGYIDSTSAPGRIDLVLTKGPFVRAADLLTDPGFETDPPGPTATIYGWDTYSAGSGNVVGESSTTLGNDGTNYLQVSSGDNGATNYNGVYQDNLSGPGAIYAADGWAYTSSANPLAGQNEAWIEVTFRDPSANILALYRSAIITTNAIATGAFAANAWIDLPVTNQYNPATFVITNTTNALVAPPGTSFVRYQVMFQGDASNSPGAVDFDDLMLTQIGGGPQGNWNIVWSDEFNETSLSNIWSYDIGGGGWGNTELEYYTDFPQNVYLSNGFLNIVGLLTNYGGQNYTSGRIKTLNTFTLEYGRIAFRAKVPGGAGLWPGLWMVPENSVYGPWAASGEIDVMESTGQLPDNVIGTIHYGGPYPDTAQSGGPSYNFIPGASLTNFNVYVLDWSSNAFSWYINGWRYETQTNWWSSSNTNNTEINPYPAPFNEPFYIIMNLAIGGAYGGPVDNSVFPADLQIDYVRYYNLTAPLQLTASGGGGPNISLSWPSNIICHLQSTTNLSNPNGWTNVVGATMPFALPPGSQSAFYRLLSP